MAAVVGTNHPRAASVPEFTRRHKISQFLVDLVKFAVDSALDGSRKIITGKKQEDNKVPEGLINIPLPTPLMTKTNPEFNVANGIHFETRMEEDMNDIKQQHKTSTKRVQESQPPNKSNDGFKEINLPMNNGRRVFIRSRL